MHTFQFKSLCCNIYFFLFSLSCSEKSDLAEVNLKREFEKNDEIIEQLYSTSNQDKE